MGSAFQALTHADPARSGISATHAFEGEAKLEVLANVVVAFGHAAQEQRVPEPRLNGVGDPECMHPLVDAKIRSNRLGGGCTEHGQGEGSARTPSAAGTWRLRPLPHGPWRPLEAVSSVPLLRCVRLGNVVQVAQWRSWDHSRQRHWCWRRLSGFLCPLLHDGQVAACPWEATWPDPTRRSPQPE
jgi:hypothetical protein